MALAYLALPVASSSCAAASSCSSCGWPPVVLPTLNRFGSRPCSKSQTFSAVVRLSAASALLWPRSARLAAAKAGGRAVVERGGGAGEGKAVVVRRLRIGRIVDLAVGLGHRIAEVGVLPEVGFDDAGDGVAEHAVLGDQHQRAVLDLLQQVGHAVGTVDLHVPLLLVDAGLVAQRPGQFPGVDQRHHRRVVGLGTQVEVAGVEPAADRQAGDVFARLERRIQLRALAVQVEMLLVGPDLARVVHVRTPVPHAVGLVDRHVVHLHREEHVHGRV